MRKRSTCSCLPAHCASWYRSWVFLSFCVTICIGFLSRLFFLFSLAWIFSTHLYSCLFLYRQFIFLFCLICFRDYRRSHSFHSFVNIVVHWPYAPVAHTMLFHALSFTCFLLLFPRSSPTFVRVGVNRNHSENQADRSSSAVFLERFDETTTPGSFSGGESFFLSQLISP